jgi:hypothetical protein
MYIFVEKLNKLEKYYLKLNKNIGIKQMTKKLFTLNYKII